MVRESFIVMPKKNKLWKWTAKRVIPVLSVLMILVLGCIGFTGCDKEKRAEDKLEDLAFTVVGERDVPQSLSELIGKKKEKEFKLTYADGQDMYIVIGAGPQEGGGFSISVKELYLTENSVVIRTETGLQRKVEAWKLDLFADVMVVDGVAMHCTYSEAVDVITEGLL